MMITRRKKNKTKSITVFVSLTVLWFKKLLILGMIMRKGKKSEIYTWHDQQ